jgi:hypothetical protein
MSAAFFSFENAAAGIAHEIGRMGIRHGCLTPVARTHWR